jgi:hypothetical protein
MVVTSRLPVLMLAVSVTLALASGATADPIGKNEKQVRAVADPILDNLLAAFNAGDYAKYSRDFDATLMEAMPEEKFRKVRDDLVNRIGKYQSRQYLGFLQPNQHTDVLWKGKFSNTTGDILIKMRVSKRKDKNVVVGLWFQ